MKKFKLICSAIVAFTVLALAGCDLEISDSEKPDILPGLVMSGTGKTTYGDNMTAYCKAMIGTWTVTTYVDGKEVSSGESITGDAWWSNNEGSTEASLANGSTVEIVATSGTADGNIFFECTDGANYVSVNPHKDAWGSGVNYTSYGAPKVSVGTVITFRVVRSGNTVNFAAKAE